MRECTAQRLTGQLVAGKPEGRTEQCKQDAAAGNGGELQDTRQQQFHNQHKAVPMTRQYAYKKC